MANKNSLACCKCSKYFSEDNLINTVKGFYCEECFSDFDK